MASSKRQLIKQNGKKPVVLFYQDEARFGRLSHTCKCWVQPKAAPKVYSQFIRESIYVFNSLSPQTGDCFSMISPLCNTYAMNIFLSMVSKQYNSHNIIMIMDKAGWHRSQELEIPNNILIQHLPPYSPELNPVELLCREGRRMHMNNGFYNNMDEVENKLIQVLKQLHHTPHQIQRLAKGYIPN